jgi:hypothetical protein
VNPHSAIEDRIGALIAAYADQAPTHVAPREMASLAAHAPRRLRVPFRLAVAPAWLTIVVLGIASIAIVGSALLVGSRPFQGEVDRTRIERTLVEPFVGLPAIGDIPSAPETGELMLSFVARIHSLGLDVHAMSLYADGRLLWSRNLEGTKPESRRVFGGHPPTTAVIEQWLTPDGVALLYGAALAATSSEPVRSGEQPRAGAADGPGVLWGGMRVRHGDRIDQVSWSDGTLPGRIADPGSWLPATAWADKRIGAYVPSHYAICVDAGTLRRLPPAAASVIVSEGSLVPEWWEPEADCYGMKTQTAREIASMLEEAGIQLNEINSGLVSSAGRIFFFPIEPDGEPMCLTCG